MKGLSFIPSISDRVKAVNFLQSRRLDETFLLDHYAWSRFDARLAEILVQKISTDWLDLNPVIINMNLKSSCWPQVMGVLADQAENLVKPKLRKVYRNWKRTLMRDIDPAPGEIFWIGLQSLGGLRARSVPEKTIKSYSRWGYYGEDILINKASSRRLNRTLLDRPTRLAVLEKLAKERTYFSVKDYMEALDHRVHRRVAELDLAHANFLKSQGRTKGKRYRSTRGS